MSFDITNVPLRNEYTATASQVAFAVSFGFFANTDLVVLANGIAQTINVAYTVTGAGVTGGGTVTFVTGRTAGDSVVIYSNLPLSRQSSYVNGGALSADSLETDLDKGLIQTQQLSRDIRRCIGIPVTDIIDPGLMQLPSVANRANKVFGFDGSGFPSMVTSVPSGTLSQASIGAYLWPRTLLEIANGVTPTYTYYEPGDVRRYGALGDGVTNDSAALAVAFLSGHEVMFGAGVYQANNLTLSGSNKALYAFGEVILRKNANGPILTISGTGCQLYGLQFRGAGAFTGDNVVITGDNVALNNCGSRTAEGRAVKSTGSHTQIIGTNDIYQTADATGTGYDIELSEGGAVATLYHKLIGLYSSQSTGGYKLLGTGTASIIGCQMGKLDIEAGSSFAGSSGPYVVGCRVNGIVTIAQSNAQFSSNTFSENVTLSATYTGTGWDQSNRIAAGKTFTNNSAAFNAITLVDNSRLDFQSPISVPNNVLISLRQASGTGGTIGMSATASDNLSITNNVATKSNQYAVTTSGKHQFIINGVVEADISGGGLGLRDGITAPGTVAGVAQIYVDTADGDLKVKFGDGTIKTIVVDV